MMDQPGSERSRDVPIIVVPEVRDFVRINAEIMNLLNLGYSRVRLEGAEGQRLLAAGLVGPWRATIEISGRTGPELGANLDAPGLQIIARDSTLDGAARGLRSGTIVVIGDGGDGLGVAQSGGLLVVTGNVGHRAGLGQAGGVLAVLGSTGRLAGDRQTGGHFFLGQGSSGPFAGRAQSGGKRLSWFEPLNAPDRVIWEHLSEAVSPWIEPSIMKRA